MRLLACKCSRDRAGRRQEELNASSRPIRTRSYELYCDGYNPQLGFDATEFRSGVSQEGETPGDARRLMGVWARASRCLCQLTRTWARKDS